MRRIRLLLVLLGLVLPAAIFLWRRTSSRRKSASRQTTVTQSGEPITREALLTDVEESITPERQGY